MSKTYGEQFDSAMACTTREEAAVWLEQEAQDLMRRWPKECPDLETAKGTLRSNLGYMAGYYDQATAQKVHDLFGADHPIFGAPDYWTRVAPEDAFTAGQRLAAERPS